MPDNCASRCFFYALLLPVTLTAQSHRDAAPLKNWPAPLYWQPTTAERSIAAKQEISGNAAGEMNPRAQTPVSSLVFVAMTPCRLVDTRAGGSFSGAFGPPSLAAKATRSLPLQASTTCSIPAVAQAYSLNVTVIPPGFLGYVTIWPSGAPQPVVSTLNDYLGTVVANAAIVSAGSDDSGSVSVYADSATDLVIDINGYYAPQSGITLAGGTTAAPSLSFAGDAGTGIYSSAAATVNIATGGKNSLTVDPSGDVDIPGSLRKNGTLFLHDLGSGNTAVGLSALSPTTTGVENTAGGAYALQGNTTACCNTAFGYQALQANTGGSSNIAIGDGSLLKNTSGNDNTAVGGLALQFNIQGSANTAVGLGALTESTGNSNTAVGATALGVSSGNSNTAVGTSALNSILNGNNNIGIGYKAGYNVAGNNNNNIEIGNLGTASDSGAIRIGTAGAQTTVFMAGIQGVTTGNNNAATVVIDSNGQLGTISSSRRFKEDIRDMGDASNGLLRLRPVTFRYKKPFDDGSKPVQYGLIAEEVAEVYPDLVARSADGQVETVKYQLLDPMLLNELQKQNATIAAQQEQIRSLEERLARVEAALGTVSTASAAR